jgi:hypothetical protein
MHKFIQSTLQVTEFDYIMEGHYNSKTLIDNKDNIEFTGVLALNVAPLLGYTELFMA